MSLPVSLLIAFLGLSAAAKARLNAVILGQPVSVPYLGIAVFLVALVLVVAALWLARHLIREGLRLRPGYGTS